MYRNCFYNSIKQAVELFTWDKDGNRVRYTSTFLPYLFLEDNRGTYKSIYNTKLVKRTFKNAFERTKFLRDSGIKRVFENFPVQQQFLIDVYSKEIDKSNFTEHPLKVLYLDIETYSPTTFPNSEDPTDPINVISCYDSLSKKIHTFGLAPYRGKDKNIIYKHCKTEEELFIKFIEYIEQDHPDIITGWNTLFFDLPYIINRGIRVCGEENIKRLSPLGVVRFTEIFVKGRQQKRYFIDGISLIDYLEIYKKFCFKERDSYKLDNIGKIELNEQKVDFGGISLATLSETDWDKFVDYNVQDVKLVVRLEEKLQFISLLRMIAYSGLCTFENAMGTITVVNGALCIKARETGKIISTFIRNEQEGTNPGAFVAEPKLGFQEQFTYFDASSLYPNTIITLNMSPETKVGKLIKTDTGYVLHHISGKNYELTEEKLKVLMDKEQLCLSKADILFTQKFKGILPIFLDDVYKKRQIVRGEMQKKKKELSQLKNDKTEEGLKKQAELKIQISQLDSKQTALKLQINSAYGYLGNKQAPIGDDDLASSTTLTGQAVIKQAALIYAQYLKQKYDIDSTAEQVRIYGDTDSVVLALKPIVSKANIPFKTDKNTLSDEVYKLVTDIENYLNTNINEWAKQELKSVDPRFSFKRELIGDIGVFLTKKRYVLHMLDDEGIKCDKFKYTGVDVVRTTMPEPIKPYAKQIIETMLMTKSVTETNNIVHKCYDIFKGLNINDISFVMGMKGYEKYSSQCTDFTTAKHMPIHVKSAYFHNLLLDKMGLTNKYEKISTGDKCRYFYVLQPNKYNIDTIGFKYEFPKEFEELFKVDYDKMFEKILFSMIDRFYKNVNWQIRKPREDVQTELFDLFG